MYFSAELTVGMDLNKKEKRMNELPLPWRILRRIVWSKKERRRVLIIAGIVLVVLVFALAIIRFGWGWTGLQGGYSTVTTHPSIHGVPTDIQQPPARTLWDVLQLLAVLAIPIVIVVFTTRSSAQQSKVEHETTLDNQRETLLQDYFNQMTELLLKENLRGAPADAETRTIARARTLSVLRRLDGVRKGSIVQFLYEAGLIDKQNPILQLDGADLSSVDLTEASLKDVCLQNANLQGALLRAANLQGADLRYADMQYAQMEGATMEYAHLRGAILSGADLFNVALKGTELEGVSGLHEAYNFNPPSDRAS